MNKLNNKNDVEYPLYMTPGTCGEIWKFISLTHAICVDDCSGVPVEDKQPQLILKHTDQHWKPVKRLK